MGPAKLKASRRNQQTEPVGKRRLNGHDNVIKMAFFKYIKFSSCGKNATHMPWQFLYTTYI